MLLWRPHLCIGVLPPRVITVDLHLNGQRTHRLRDTRTASLRYVTGTIDERRNPSRNASARNVQSDYLKHSSQKRIADLLSVPLHQSTLHYNRACSSQQSLVHCESVKRKESSKAVLRRHNICSSFCQQCLTQVEEHLRCTQRMLMLLDNQWVSCCDDNRACSGRALYSIRLDSSRLAYCLLRLRSAKEINKSSACQ